MLPSLKQPQVPVTSRPRVLRLWVALALFCLEVPGATTVRCCWLLLFWRFIITCEPRAMEVKCPNRERVVRCHLISSRTASSVCRSSNTVLASPEIHIASWKKA